MPWEVNEFPPEYLDRILGIVNDLPGMRAGINKLEEIKAAYRRKMDPKTSKTR